jgi:hypothetical protein
MTTPEQVEADNKRQKELLDRFYGIERAALSGQKKFINSLPSPGSWSMRQEQTVRGIIHQIERYMDDIQDGMDIDFDEFCF